MRTISVDGSLTYRVPAGVQVLLVDDGAQSEATITVIVERDASAIYKGVFTVRDVMVQRAVIVHCDGAGSSACIEISCHTQGSGQFSLVTQQNHTASHTTSAARILGVSGNNSKASVTSTILIEKNLGGVAATQIHKHLLLDSGSRAVSIPALDILSNDVSCSHGSAITHLDATQLFYLNARGYTTEEARDAMVKAFLMI